MPGPGPQWVRVAHKGLGQESGVGTGKHSRTLLRVIVSGECRNHESTGESWDQGPRIQAGPEGERQRAESEIITRRPGFKPSSRAEAGRRFQEGQGNFASVIGPQRSSTWGQLEILGQGVFPLPWVSEQSLVWETKACHGTQGSPRAADECSSDRPGPQRMGPAAWLPHLRPQKLSMAIPAELCPWLKHENVSPSRWGFAVEFLVGLLEDYTPYPYWFPGYSGPLFSGDIF